MTHYPNGECYCGCGGVTPPQSYFLPGHDKRAEAKVIREKYGGVIEFLVAHGYGPKAKSDTTVTTESGIS